MAQISGLTVRHHSRAHFDLIVEFIVAPDQRDQIRFSSMSASRASHSVRGRGTDISSGGMGWECAQFLPRGCQGRLRVMRPGFNPDEASGQDDVIFEHDAKVRRVIMTDDDPLYAIGVAFISPSSDMDERVRHVQELAQEASSESEGHGNA